MTGQASLALEAVLFLLSFDIDDEDDRLDLIAGIGNMADATAKLAGASDFKSLREKPNVMQTMQFLSITKSEFEAARIESDSPDPGWFAVLHLLGLEVVNGLPKDRDIRTATAMALEMYEFFHEFLEEKANAPNP